MSVMLIGCATTGSNPYSYFERLSIEALRIAAGKRFRGNVLWKLL